MTHSLTGAVQHTFGYIITAMNTAFLVADFGHKTVADVALTYPQSIHILNRHGLDYCCHGGTAFADACAVQDLDPNQVWMEIRQQRPASGTMRFDDWSTPLLIDFIQQHHHRYVRESIPEIQGLLDRICEKHGTDQPFLIKLQKTFGLLADELLAHLPKEEEILFPMILHFTGEGSKNSDIYPRVEAPVAVMEHEHESAGDLIKLMRSLTDDYTVPEFACPTYQYTFRKLQEFDEDLMQHIHLENNIVFARLKG